MSKKSKVITSKRFSRTFRRVFSKKYLKKLVRAHTIDQHSKKLFFSGFLTFMVLIILLRPKGTALRDLETYSQAKFIQELSGMPAAAHSSIGERLKKIPVEMMDQLLERAQKELGKRYRWKEPLFPRVKIFDTTTFSVSPKHFEWAANNGKRNAARFVFVMDHKSGGIGKIIDAHETTSDNSVFETVVKNTRPGLTWVFDRGYNRLTTLKGIVKKRGHFITRWSGSFSWTVKSRRKISKDDQLTDGWEIIADEIGTAGADSNPGQMTGRKITCRHPDKKDLFIIFTDIMKAHANRLVKMYVARWPIEVYFRHVKSTLGTLHFPSRSPEGIHNWLVLVALSILLIQDITFKRHKKEKERLNATGFPFTSRWREVWLIIMDEAHDRYHGEGYGEIT